MKKRLEKRFFSVAAAVFLLTVSVLPAAATSYGSVDMGYSGVLDTQTGKPVTGASSTGGSSSRISIGDGAVYDTSSNRYCYSVDGGEVEMNYPSGIVTTSPVSISVPEGMTARLFRNGTEIENADLSSIAAPGKYILRFSETEMTYLSFTVVGELTGIITGYQLPAGFSVVSATLDGAAVVASSYVDMSREGTYAVKYRCEKTGVSYTLNVTIDNTPPVLKLEGVENGRTRQPVDISDIEPGAAISIMLNGEKIKYEDVLSESGTYNIILQDEAGNTSAYTFVIGIYFNLSAGLFVLILVALLAALAIYLVLSRKKMRVR